MRLTIAVLILIALLGAGLAWLAGSGALAASVRAAAVAQVSQALGREVRVSRMAGDPLRGIVLDGVRIAAPPGERGTFVDVTRIVLRFRPLALLVDLLRGRGPATSLATIELNRPVLTLSRDAAGQWNIPRLPQRRKGGGGLAAFTGTVEVREGTLLVLDAWNRPVPFGAHFERVTGSVSWSDSPRLRLEVDAVDTSGRTPALLHVAATVLPADAVVDLVFTTRGASAAHWGPYLAHLDWLRWTGGTVDGTARLLVSRRGAAMAFDYRATFQLHEGRAVLVPSQVALTDIEGPLVLDNRRVTSDGLTMMVESSPVWVRGEIAYLADAHLDLAIRSASLDLATLKRLFFPSTGLQISGRTGGEARVVGPLDALLVDGDVTSGAGHVQGQTFSDLSTHLQLYGGVLVFDDLDASVDDGRARGYARLTLPTLEFFVLADLERVDARGLTSLDLLPLPMKGKATGFIAAAGRPGAVIGQARLGLASGDVAGMVIDRADVVLGFERGIVEVDRFEAHRGPAVAHATGTIGLGGSLDLALVATDVNLQAVGRLVGPGQWLAGTADLAGRVAGTVLVPVVSGRLDAREGRLGPFPFDQATGSLTLGTTGLVTPGLLLRDGEGVYEAVGEVRWGAPESVDLAIRAHRIPAQRLLDVAKVPLDAEGTVSGTVRLTGTFTDPQADGALTLSDGIVAGQPVDRLIAAFRWARGALSLDDAALEVNASRISIHGSVDPRGQLALSFAAPAFDLHDVAALRNGAVHADGIIILEGTLGGSLTAPTVTAALSSSTVRLNGQPIDRVEGTAHYQRGRLILAPLSFLHEGGTLQLAGSTLLGEDPVLDWHASAQQVRIRTLLGLLRIQPRFALDGLVDGEIAVSGRASDPAAVLVAQLTDGVAGDHAIRHAAVNATLAGHAITLRTLSVTPEQGTMIGAGRIDLSGTSDLELNGQGLSLSLLQSVAGGRRSLEGELEFTLQISGNLADPLVGLSAAVTNGMVGGTPFDRMLLQAYYRDGQFSIEQGLVQQDRHKVKLTGTVPVDPLGLRLDEARPVDVHVALVDADLSMVSLLTERIEEGRGPLAGELHLTGTLAQPHLQGALAGSGGVLRLRGLEPSLTDLEGRLEFADGEIRVAELRARAGDGAVAISGLIGLQRFKPNRVALAMEAVGARLQYAPYFDGVADGILRLEGPVDGLSVSGSLTLRRGDLFVLPVHTLERTSGTDFDPVLHLEVTAGDELWVNLGQLRLQVQGTVRAQGTLLHPRLAGEVQSTRGTFTAFNSAFALTEGQATFAEFRGTTPFVDARAETDVQLVSPPGSENRFETVHVFLHITGTPDDLAVEVTSDPPLTRGEILAALAERVGVTRLLRGESVETMLQAEMSAAVFGSVSRAMAQAFGLEELTIAYDVERPLTLRVGKLIVRNLYVTLTSAFGVDPRSVWSMEYRLTPSTMFSFSVDNLGTYDVLWRITHRF